MGNASCRVRCGPGQDPIIRGNVPHASSGKEGSTERSLLCGCRPSTDIWVAWVTCDATLASTGALYSVANWMQVRRGVHAAGVRER